MRGSESIQVLPAAWEAPARVRALTTLRTGGVSTGPFESLNLGDRAGDAPDAVAENRRRLIHALALPAEPAWLKQVHGTRCVDVSQMTGSEEADGGYADQPGRVCTVLTADCLPLFVCDDAGSRVGLFHVGWKGLAGGMVESALSVFDNRPDIHCWLGPSIGRDAFEIGPEVRETLLESGNETCFRPSRTPGRWMADLYGLVARKLEQGGVRHIGWDAAACTYSDSRRFFSYRRSRECGRMASLIWVEE